jgi:hypothetical protein
MDFQTSLSHALEYSVSIDNAARMQAENFMQQAKGTQGCVQSLLAISTNAEVTTLTSTYI